MVIPLFVLANAVGSALAALLALAVFRVLAYRGGLCYPEDEQASLPPLAQIPDPH